MSLKNILSSSFIYLIYLFYWSQDHNAKLEQSILQTGFPLLDK